MKDYPYIPETRREFIRDKRRSIKKCRKVVDELHTGCALVKVFGGTEFHKAVNQMRSALQIMDDITKPLS